MQFTRINDDVVSVELSVDTLYTIGNALDIVVDMKDDTSERELALANGFKNAYRSFKKDETVPAEPDENSGLE